MTNARAFVFALGAGVIAALSYVFWKIETLDPEGGCTERQYFSLCANAFVTSLFDDRPWDFSTLPTDRALLERFQTYRSDFEEMANEIARTSQLQYMITLNPKWRDKHNVLVVDGISFYPQTSDEKAKHTSRTWGYFLPVADTRYVRDATSDDMSMLLRSKGYVFYRSPPLIEDGYVMSFPDANGHRIRQYQILSSLDGPPWPSDWQSGYCWLKEIEPQWFLSLCRDRVGG